MPPFQFQNPFDAFRARNMLNPLGPTAAPKRFGQDYPTTPMPRLQTQPSMQDDSSRYYDEMERLQNNVGPGLQAYKDYLTRLPKREDYRPTVWTRIASALTGASMGLRNPAEGVQAAQDLNSSDYRSAVADYANEGIGLKERANLEQDELDSKIRALSNARAMGLKYDEFALKQAEAEAKARQGETTANAAMLRARAYAQSVQKPGYDAQPQQDGSVLYVNKANPKDTITVAAKTIAAGQLGVARSNAATNARNANIAQQNADTNRTRAYDYGRYVDQAGGRGHIHTPQEQSQAEDLALRQMASDPMFQDFISSDKDGYMNVSGDDGSEDYQDFLTALDAKVQEILKGGTTRGRRR